MTPAEWTTTWTLPKGLERLPEKLSQHPLPFATSAWTAMALLAGALNLGYNRLRLSLGFPA